MGPTALVTTAGGVALVHALAGPDHYIPFLALARARGWSMSRTLTVTAACGLGHVASSVLLGVLLVGVAQSASTWVAVEALGGEVAGWLLLGFGAAYTVWGVRVALAPRVALHRVHHVALGPWVLFLVFLFGPCEPLIPLVIVPAAQHSWGVLLSVCAVFGLVTVVSMTVVVAGAYLGAAKLAGSGRGRWSHALAGAALTACGVAVRMGL